MYGPTKLPIDLGGLAYEDVTADAVLRMLMLDNEPDTVIQQTGSSAATATLQGGNSTADIFSASGGPKPKLPFCLDFTGPGEFILTTYAVMPAAGTIALRIFPEEAAEMVCGNRHTVSPNNGFFINVTASGFLYAVLDTSTGAFNVGPGNVNIVDAAWHDIVLTWGDGVANLYLDSAEEPHATVAYTGTFGTVSPLMVGNQPQAPDPCNCRMVDCDLWERVLPPEEIAAWMDGPRSLPASPA